MKLRILSTLLLWLTASMVVSAQFKVTPDGIVAEDGKKFVVEKIKGSQAQLFQRAMSVLTSMLKSSDCELKSNEPDIIVISNNSMKIKKDYIAGIKDKYSATWSLEIKFKPNRIRIDAPTISELKCRKSIIELGKGGAIEVGSGLNRKGYLFKDDGTPRETDMIKQIEDNLNAFIGELVNRVKTYETSDDNKW